MYILDSSARFARALGLEPWWALPWAVGPPLGPGGALWGSGPGGALTNTEKTQFQRLKRVKYLNLNHFYKTDFQHRETSKTQTKTHVGHNILNLCCAVGHHQRKS